MRLSGYLTLAAVIRLVAAKLSVSQGKLSIIDSVSSSASLTSTFSSESTAPSPPVRDVTLSSTDTLKLSFHLSDAETSQPVQPQQVVVSWTPVREHEKKERGRHFAAVVKVRSNGKARWELDLARAPTSFLSLSREPISLTLLLGSLEHEAVALALGTFQLSRSLSLPFPYPPNEDLPAHWEIEKYSEQPRIDWTFKSGEKKVGTFVSVSGLSLVFAPWLVLLSVVTYLRPSLSLRSPTISQTILLATVIAFEVLFVVYWVQLRLIPTLPYFGLLSAIALLSGKKALSDMRKSRLQRERRETGKMQ